MYCWIHGLYIAVDTHNAVATEASVANTCSNPSMPSTRCFLRHALVSYLAYGLYNLWFDMILTTQAWKQTLPPSDRALYYTSARLFDCKYLSCKICFNVLNYVFTLFILNLLMFSKN